jgi:DNA primase
MRVRVDVGALLASLGIRARRGGDGWTALCPARRHRDDQHVGSWSIVDDPRDERHALSYCFACGWGGDARALVREVLDVQYGAEDWIAEFATVEEDDVPYLAQLEVARPKVFRFPPGVESLDILTWPQPFRRYLAERGVTVSQARRWGLAFALEGRLAGRVVIPTRAESGRLLSYTARAVDRGRLRYLTPDGDEGADPGAVFGEERWGPPGGTVAVSEGCFDALAVERAAPELSVAVLGTGGAGNARSPLVAEKLRRFDAAVVVTDADAAGDLAYEEVRAMLDGKPVARARPPEGWDANEMDPRELRAMITGALRWDRTT